MTTYDIVRAKLNAGELLLGTHIFCGTPMLTEAIASIGFDMLWIDMEHTAIDKAQVMDNLIAARAGGTASMVRIPWNDPVLAKPILDMGPDAILFPFIRTPEEARLAISSCLYPPQGVRGYGPLRALQYGARTPGEYVHEDYQHLLKMVQIEHIDAVDCLDELAQIEGIDVFIVGMNDLAGSVGHIGEPLHPDMFPIYERIGASLRGKKPFGVSLDLREDSFSWWIKNGAQILFSGHDVAYVYAGAHNTLEQQKQIVAKVRKA